MRSLITLLSSVGVMFWFPHPCNSSCFLNSVAVFEVSIVKASQLLGALFKSFFSGICAMEKDFRNDVEL